jgi:hypothetical protein
MIYNTDGAIMEWLKSCFGGRIHLSHKKVRPLATRHLYTWRLAAKAGRPVLEGMLPYLIIKKDQIEAMLKLIDLMGAAGCQFVPEDVMTERLALVDEIKTAKWKERPYAAG